MSLGDRLRLYRERSGLSLRHVAKLLPVSHSTLSQWEHNVHQPSLSDLEKLAVIYGCTVADFVADADVDLLKTAPREPDEQRATIDRWQSLAETLAAAMRMQAENERQRIENERLRIEKVDAVAQDNLRRLLDKLDRLEADTHALRREAEGAAAGP